jgi:hypothetical protein
MRPERQGLSAYFGVRTRCAALVFDLSAKSKSGAKRRTQEAIWKFLSVLLY